MRSTGNKGARPARSQILRAASLAAMRPQSRSDRNRSSSVGCLRPTEDERLRSLRLWGRIAAKEAARRIWLRAGLAPLFPVDLMIEPDTTGRPVLHSRLNPDRDDMPAVSIAYTD